MKILIACEHSGTVREAFRARGANAWSCDLLPASDGSRFHRQADLFEVIREGWDILIAHPPCTYVNSAGLHWISRGRIEADGRPRAEHQKEALEFITKIWRAPIDRIALENPQGCINTKLSFMPKPQYVQPYEFGDDASKKTGLWLKGLPHLAIEPAAYFPPRLVCDTEECRFVFTYGLHRCPKCGGEKFKPRWGNQTDSGQNKLPPTADRGHLRAITYPGIANAMAAKWRNIC